MKLMEPFWCSTLLSGEYHSKVIKPSKQQFRMSLAMYTVVLDEINATIFSQFLFLSAQLVIFFPGCIEKSMRTHMGRHLAEKMLPDMEAVIKSYNSEQGMECVKISQEAGKIAIAACTPMMRRIHEGHSNSGELVFIDASGGMDRYDCRIFLLLTHSPAGGLPLGCLITTSESKETIISALKLFNEVMPKKAFFGRGKKGPEVFLTDDSETERRRLNAVYPDAKVVLCVFHLLQALWRYLWQAKMPFSRKTDHIYWGL